MKSESIASPLDDLTYDLVAALHEKATALEAYAKYLRDAEDDDELRDLFEQMREQDASTIETLKEVLARRLDEDLGFEDIDEEEEEEEEDEELADFSDEEGEVNGRTEGSPPRRGESTRRS